MKIAVLAAVYNEEKFIAEFLSLLPKNIPAVIVNDGSADKTAEIISEYSVRESCIKLLSMPHNCGKSAAVKFGLSYISSCSELCSTEYVVLIDGDMQIHPKYIELIAEAAEKLNTDMLVACRSLKGYPFLKVLGNKILSMQASVLSGTVWKDSLCGLRCIKKSCIAEICQVIRGGRYCCEQDMCIGLPLRGFKTACCFDIEVGHLRSNSRLTDAASIFFSGFLCWFKEKVLSF